MRAVQLPTDVRSPEAAADVDRLNEALDRLLPARTSGNLLIGTWNLRGFGGLAAKWQSGPGDSPRRDWHSVECIAQVVRRFDVTAIQETRRNTSSLAALLHVLGPGFRVITSDVTEGGPGNGERLAFVYDAERITPSGLVGEIVLESTPEQQVKQFARTPYAAGFVRGGVEFVLTTVHILWGEDPEERLGELTRFATCMAKWADRRDDWNRNLMVLGDFNLERYGDPLYVAFMSTGLLPPAELDQVPRTIFDHPTKPHFYDQVAWFRHPDHLDRSVLEGLAYTGRCGSFDFVPLAFRGLSKTELSWRISDHYPLWVEFDVVSEPGRTPVPTPDA